MGSSSSWVSGLWFVEFVYSNIKIAVVEGQCQCQLSAFDSEPQLYVVSPGEQRGQHREPILTFVTSGSLQLFKNKRWKEEQWKAWLHCIYRVGVRAFSDCVLLPKSQGYNCWQLDPLRRMWATETLLLFVLGTDGLLPWCLKHLRHFDKCFSTP